MASMHFDDLIHKGNDVAALRFFIVQYCINGPSGGAKGKALLDRIADKLTPKEVESLDDCIHAPIADGTCPGCHYCLARQFFGDSASLGESGDYSEAYEIDCNYCPNCGQRLDWRTKK